MTSARAQGKRVEVADALSVMKVLYCMRITSGRDADGAEPAGRARVLMRLGPGLAPPDANERNMVNAKRTSVRALAAFVAAALLAGQLPAAECVMAHDDASATRSVAAVESSHAESHHHAEASTDSPTSHHQHDGGESASCTMLVSCGAPALANSTIALKAIQGISNELTLSVASQHLNPTLLSLTPPPRA